MLGDEERVRTLRFLPAGVGGDGEALPYIGESSPFHFWGAGWGGSGGFCCLEGSGLSSREPLTRSCTSVGILWPEDKGKARSLWTLRVVEI